MDPLSKVLGDDLHQLVSGAKFLMVGAGGIGCELLKNLVLSGFQNIEVIDLDTIDVSNLNRQFLFQKRHVGKPKAEVAKDSALSFNPRANIKSHHASVFNPEYSTNYFKQFTLVLNALDNKAARSHVNRMCLAADVPLVESGTAGYLGQVTVIKKGETECYDCLPKPTAKTFPGCTIRNTPSEPIHCIVWAKHLFNQLFGEVDADNEVAPDMTDPEAAKGGAVATEGASSDSTASSTQESCGTREWAERVDYDPEKIFTKLFHDDVVYLLSMDNLWKKRRPPTPLDYHSLPAEAHDEVNGSSGNLRDQKMWSLQVAVDTLGRTLGELKVARQQRTDKQLVWDKDDDESLDFVTAVANLRAHVFGIKRKSRFECKAMAGNIIPAIATTNAVIAGLVVMEAFKILQGKVSDCKTIYLSKQPNARKKLLVPCSLVEPNPKCYVCSSKPEVSLTLNTSSLTVKTFEDRVLKERFGMLAPDVEIQDGKGTILISSEEGETEQNGPRPLGVFGVASGSRLQADDFFQNYTLVVNIEHSDDLAADEFVVAGDIPAPEPEPEKEQTAAAPAADTSDVVVENRKRRASDDLVADAKRTRTEDTGVIAVDDDLEIIS
eukprot:scpid51679/ scgid4471/ SUMO-activating enzyme subunit 2; Anthracycline-associated resistance ARX; Ubiquitin-like 1-activating enzyme E1B